MLPLVGHAVISHLGCLCFVSLFFSLSRYCGNSSVAMPAEVERCRITLKSKAVLLGGWCVAGLL